MISGDRSTALTALARTGFSRLAEADAGLGELGQLTGAGRADAMALAQRVADPDRALSALLQIARRDPGAIRSAAADAGTWRALWDIVGASDGFAEFYLRHPDEIAHLAGAGLTVPDEHLMRTELHYTETQGDEMVMLVGTAYHHLSQIDGSLRITHKRVNLINCDAALPAVQLFI